MPAIHRLATMVICASCLTFSARAETTPAAIWDDLIEGNKRFITDKEKDRPLIATREALYSTQAPRVVVLGCADSRVSPTLIFDKNLGELFEIRIAGNVADPMALGSIEYAVEHLKSSVIVVLGHEKCGAVAAAASGEKMASPNLDAVVSRIGLAIKKETDALAQVKANVKASAAHLTAGSEVLKKAVEAGKVTVIPAVYLMKTGEVAKVD